MAISFNTGAKNSATTASSVTLAIPAGVLVNDVMLLVVEVFCETGTAPTIGFSGGGGTWTKATMSTGANPEVATAGSSIWNYGYAYYRVATSGDPGQTVTITETGSSSGTTWMSVAMAAYTGANTTTPIDVAFGNNAQGTSGGTAPSGNTATTGDWGVYMAAAGINGTPLTGPSTSRENVVSSASIGAAVNDSNGSVGSSGTSIGGGSWTQAGNTSNWWSLFTIGLAVASAPSTNADAGLATGTGTALSPQAAVAANAGLAHGTGTAQQPLVSSVVAGLAHGTGTAQQPSAAISVHAGLATGTGTALNAPPPVWRLMDGASGRPGNGPGSVTSHSGNFTAGISWEVTQDGLWLDGYWHWVPTGGDTTARKFALWQLTDTAHGVDNVLVPASTVTSGTMTVNAWNFTALATPIGLSAGVPYVAVVGWVTVNGFSETTGQFGTGDPYAAGITNGPLFAYSDQSGSAAEPFTTNYNQGLFGTSTADPAVTMPTTGDSSANFWVDVQVTSVPPAGASYRLWPSQPYAIGWVNDTANNFTLATEFNLSATCALGKIWFYSQAGVTQLPTECGIWNVNTQALVSGTDNASPSWSGAAGSGWVSCSYTGVTLPAGDYKVAVLNAAGSPAIWNPTTNAYWGTGTGVGGITNGPLSAPDTTHATSPGQDTFNSGATFTYPLTYSSPANGANYWIDLEVVPGGAPVSANAGLATGTGAAGAPGGAVAAGAGLAQGTGAAPGPQDAIAATAVLAHGTAAALAATINTSASTNVNAGLATATGTAQQPAAAVTVQAGEATGTGSASSATVPGGSKASALLAVVFP